MSIFTICSNVRTKERKSPELGFLWNATEEVWGFGFCAVTSEHRCFVFVVPQTRPRALRIISRVRQVRSTASRWRGGVTALPSALTTAMRWTVPCARSSSFSVTVDSVSMLNCAATENRTAPTDPTNTTATVWLVTWPLSHDHSHMTTVTWLLASEMKANQAIG